MSEQWRLVKTNEKVGLVEKSIDKNAVRPHTVTRCEKFTFSSVCKWHTRDAKILKMNLRHINYFNLKLF